MIRIFTLVSMLSVLGACSQETAAPGASPKASMAGHEMHMAMPPGEPVSGQSLHQLAGTWTDQQGKPVRLADFAGRPVVLAMVYTHCEHACPRIIADMRRIRSAFPDQADQMVFVLASIDPGRDTMARLQAFGEETGLTGQGWRLMRAPEGTVRELAAVLGVQYRRTSPEDFAHSNLISVLGPGGEIRHQQKGLGSAPDATIAAIRELLS